MPIYSTLEQALVAMSGTDQLNDQQLALYTAYEAIVEQYGQFDKGIGASGSHYAEENPFADQGMICANCVYYSEGACEIVSGSIDPNAICKFWIIPENRLKGA